VCYTVNNRKRQEFHVYRSRPALAFAALFVTLLAPLPCASQTKPKPKPAPPKITEAEIAEQHRLIETQRQPTVDESLALMRRVCDWQLANLRPFASAQIDWVRGTLTAGLMATYYATTDMQYLRAFRKLAEESQWRLGSRVRHADDQTISQAYAETYMLDRDPVMIQAMRKNFDEMISAPKRGREEWSWADALFMSPPALARLSAATGERKYLDFMNTMWLDTADLLYDKQEHLFYRDKNFMPRADGTQRLEKNGRKIFWSRGNGWVIAGICRVLDYMPKDYPDRHKYEDIYRQMAAKLIQTQGGDGLWSASQLDPASYPLGETSGSGFFCFALAWGINNGYLDEAKYRPAVEKAWRGLAACVEPSGKLGYSQHAAGSPGHSLRNYSDEYTCGAFLLAGNEVVKMMGSRKGAGVRIEVRNALDVHRPRETVEIPWSQLEDRIPGLVPSRVLLRDEAGAEIVTQVVYRDGAPSSLLFQADLGPQENKTFEVTVGDRKPLGLSASKTYGTFVPTRKDDFAWENDRIAFRMYGPALEQAGEISSGIDVWLKRVRSPIIDKWYAPGAGSYHVDHGEGLDCYNVGSTRGCGGLGIWSGGKLYVSGNFKSWRILANGPIRTTFELTYDFWDAGGRRFSEIKRISLDAGSNLNRIESTFRSDKPGPFAVGIGLTGTGGVTRDAARGILSVWQPMGQNGSIGTGMVIDPAKVADMVAVERQNLVIVNASPGDVVSYYAGAGWTKSGDFSDAAAWQSHLGAHQQSVQSPLEVTVR
jgi:unsaturated rhamnogalacturonyl hydrolase